MHLNIDRIAYTNRIRNCILCGYKTQYLAIVPFNIPEHIDPDVTVDVARLPIHKFHLKGEGNTL